MTALTTREAAQTSPADAREVRRSTAARGQVDVIVLVGALAAAMSLALMVATRVITDPGPVGFTVITYLLFLVIYGVLVSLRDNPLAVRDRLVAVVIHGLAGLALMALLYVVTFIFFRGREALVHFNFYTNDMRAAGPLEPLSVGGIIHAAVGTLVETSITLILVAPLGVACAVFLSEVRGPFPRFVRTVAEAMTALPSIVAGLFIFASVILTFGLARSGFAASLALGVMMLPIVIRASDVVLRLVPGSLREASLAMGAGQWRTVWHVVLPTARSGLTTAVLLGTARVVGETSPVLITAGYGAALNLNPTAGPMVSLPLAAFTFAGSPEPNMIARGFGAAAALLTLVFVLFALARLLGGRPAGELSARQQRRRAEQSLRDAERLADRGYREVATSEGLL
ncbi:MAG: ABC transporter permease subunit [Pseudonocardiales bacterium]|nr:ABC transporter permease subunit [Pseudonocardiales bacterium]